MNKQNNDYYLFVVKVMLSARVCVFYRCYNIIPHRNINVCEKIAFCLADIISSPVVCSLCRL